MMHPFVIKFNINQQPDNCQVESSTNSRDKGVSECEGIGLIMGEPLFTKLYGHGYPHTPTTNHCQTLIPTI